LGIDYSPALYVKVVDENGKTWDKYKEQFPDNIVWECDDKVKISWWPIRAGEGPVGRQYAA